MKILVTGTEGQLARSLVERARDFQNMEVVRIGRPLVDLAEPGSAATAIQAIRPDLVINAAAYTAVDRAEGEPDLCYRINAVAAGEVAEAAASVGAPMIQLSTDYVFDGRALEPYDEAAATNPINVYGASKLAGEEAVREANLRHLVLRTSWVYSPFGSNFVKTMLGLAGERDSIQVVDDQVGCPTSALDLANALLRVATDHLDDLLVQPGRTFHLAGVGSCSWAGLAGEIFRLSAAKGGPTAEVEPVPTAPLRTIAKRPAYSVLNSGAFTAQFGFGLPAWQESLAAVIRRA